jgi:hypothetical protein
MSSFFAGLTKREIAAFKAGSWSSIPVDWIVENYGIPFAKEKLGPEAFYSHINKMGSRRLTKYQPAKKYGAKKYRVANHVATTVMRSPVLLGMVDRKVHASGISGTGIAAHSIQSTQLYNVAQGVNMGDRIGRQIRALTVHVNGYFRNLSNTKTCFLRVLCVQDKKPQLGGLNVNLFVPFSNANNPQDFGAAPNHDTVRLPINTDRYMVLSDRLHKLAPNTADNGGANGKVVKYTIKVNKNLNYLNDGSSASDSINPNIHMLYWAETEDSSTLTPFFNGALDMFEHFTG